MDYMSDGQNNFNQGGNVNPYAQPQVQRPQQGQNQVPVQGNPYAQPQRNVQSGGYGQPQQVQRPQQVQNSQQFQTPQQAQRPQQVPQGQQGYAPNNYPQQNAYNQQNQVNFNKPNNSQPIQGWSWGGFFLGLQMALGHGKWIMLLSFLPIANLVMPIVAGFKMHEWCYNSGRYNSVAEYNASMRVWDKAGLFTFLVALVVCIVFFVLWGAFFGAIIASLVKSPSYY